MLTFHLLVAALWFQTNSNRWKASRVAHKRELAKAGIFFSSVGLFTYLGYAKARQVFVKEKLKLVEKYSIKASSK